MSYTKWSNTTIDVILKDTMFLRIGNYEKKQGIFRIKCLKDNYEWDVRWNNIYRTIKEKRHACPKCTNHIPLNNDVVDLRLKDRNIERVDNYTHSHIKMKFRCLVCNNIWETKPNKILIAKHGCPECGKNKCIENNPNRLSNKIIDERLLNRSITRIGNFTTDKTPILFKCNIDGCEWLATPNNVYKKTRPTGCPECKLKKVSQGNEYRPLSSNEVIDERIKDRKIIRIDNYINKETKIHWKCEICNNIWMTKPGNILMGGGCPNCKNKGERLLKELLETYIVSPIIHHKTFKFNDRKYIVDFYIEINNRRIIIERQGEQHYRPVNLFGGSPAFKKQLKRDDELRQYCRENNIELYEIPFWLSNEDVINKVKEITNGQSFRKP